MWHLLFGPQSFLKREFIQTLRGRLLPQEVGFGNFQEFTAKKDSLNTLFDFLLTAPFLGEKRLAVLWAVDELSKDEQSSLLAFLEKKISTAELILESGQSSIKKNSFLVQLGEKCRQTPCYTPFDKDLPRWVEGRAQKRFKQIESQAARLVIERIGKDLASLDMAIEQLALLGGTKTDIELKDVQDLLGKSVQADVFQMIDFIAEGKKASALVVLTSLGKEGSKSYEIMGALVGQLERLRKAVRMLEASRSTQEIAAELKMHPFYFEKFLNQARQVSAEKIDWLLRRLLDCDESIKTGILNDERALERFILEVR